MPGRHSIAVRELPKRMKVDLATFPESPTAARGALAEGALRPAAVAPPAGLSCGGTTSAEEEGGRRGRQGIYKRFLESSGAAADGVAGGTVDGGSRGVAAGGGGGGGGDGGDAATMAFRRSVNAAARASMDGGRRPLPADRGVGEVFAAGVFERIGNLHVDKPAGHFTLRPMCSIGGNTAV